MKHFMAAVKTVVLSSFLAESSFAAIAYVDATQGAAGNTALAAGGTFTGSGGAASATNWRDRTGLANGSTIFEAGGVAGTTTDAPELVTTISGLTAGSTYSVTTYFWNSTSGPQNWNLSAGLNPTGLTVYTATSGTPAGATVAPAAVAADFSGTVLVAEADRVMYQISLGNAVANVSGVIKVYVDDLPSQNNPVQRSWYDGVGIAATPEPASLSAVLLVGGLVARRCRASAAI